MKRAVSTGVLASVALIAAMNAWPLFGPVAAQPKLTPPSASSGSELPVQMSDRFEGIVQRVLPSVVSIEAVKQAIYNRALAVIE